MPAGIGSGMRLKLNGMGDFGKDGKGDLYIEINELKDSVLQRDRGQYNSQCEYTLLYGHTRRIKSGCPHSGRGKGHRDIAGYCPWHEGGREGSWDKRLNSSSKGDEIVIINVGIPKTLSASERKLIENFKEINSGKGTDQTQKKFGLF